MSVAIAAAFTTGFASKQELDSNPCKGGYPDPCEEGFPCQPPIWQALANLPCEEGSTKVQAGGDVTVGSMGTMTADLQPIGEAFPNVDMCVVNAHWHLGAEHFHTGTYDLNGWSWFQDHEDDIDHLIKRAEVRSQMHPKTGVKIHFKSYLFGKHYHHRLRELRRRVMTEEIEPGNFCPGFDMRDPGYTTPYKWKYCSNMHVGLTYEIHWPHSNLGACGTKWQYQSHFMDGVLCKANEQGMSPKDATAAVFTGEDNYTEREAKLGVQAQIFTVVNDPEYDYPDWDMLGGWNVDLAQDIAIYQGSTTGQKNGNEDCKGTGGMVTWQVDRDCHKVSAKAFDGLCKAMLEQKDDMSGDTHPHNARVTTADFITSDVAMPEGLTAAELGH